MSEQNESGFGIPVPEMTEAGEAALAEARQRDAGQFVPDRVVPVDGVLRLARLDPGDDATVEALFDAGVIRHVEIEPMVIMKMERPAQGAKIAGGGLELPWLLTVGLSASASSQRSLPSGLLPARTRSFWAYVRRLPVAFGFGGAVYDVGIAVTDAAMQTRPGGPGGGLHPVNPFGSAAASPFEFSRKLGLVLPGDPGNGPPIPCWLWRAQARRDELGGDIAWEHLSRFPEVDDALGRVYSDAPSGLTAVPLYRHSNGMLACAIGTRNPGYDGGPAPRVANRSEMELAWRQEPYHVAPALSGPAVALQAVGQYSELNALRAQVSEARAETEAARALHRVEVSAISRALIAEANRRDWCSEYDEFVAEVNRSLQVEMDTRQKDFKVGIDVTATVWVETSASTEEEARSNVDNWDVRNALRDHASDINIDWEYGEVRLAD